MEDTDIKNFLTVHIILGTSKYAKIKTHKTQRIGNMGESVAEYTKFGWSLMSPVAETDVNNMFLTQTSAADDEMLYRLDVLGLEDIPTGDQNVVHAEFRKQLQRSPEGWYEAALPWRGNHSPLPNNKAGSLRRLGSLV